MISKTPIGTSLKLRRWTILSDVQTAQKELDSAIEKERALVAAINAGKNFKRALEATRKVPAPEEVPDEDLANYFYNLERDLNKARVNKARNGTQFSSLM